MNQSLKELDSSVMLIAEYSTAFEGVTRSVEEGGLGFDYKWDIEAAKAKGKHLGRPYNLLPKNATVIIEQWSNKEIGTKAACELLGISKTTFYRLLKRQGK